jgi:hypothetical protein
MNPICVNCAVTMVCEQNEFIVSDQQVGSFPATQWSGDLYGCPKCKCKIVTGFSKTGVRSAGPADLIFKRS